MPATDSRLAQRKFQSAVIVHAKKSAAVTRKMNVVHTV